MKNKKPFIKNKIIRWILINVGSVTGFAIIVCSILFLFVKADYALQKANYQADLEHQAQIKKLLHPTKKNLNEKAISKTFTEDDDYNTNDNMSDDDNINRQINIYLNSIKNLKEYKVSLKTVPEKDDTNYTPLYTGKSFIMLPEDDSTPLTKIVTLTKK